MKTSLTSTFHLDLASPNKVNSSVRPKATKQNTAIKPLKLNTNLARQEIRTTKYGFEETFKSKALAQRSNMKTRDENIIELSKTKTFLLIVGALLFVALGIWMLQMDSTTIQSQHRFNNPLFVHGIGVVSIAFFGLCGLLWIRKLFDRKPGLVLSADGIFDNSSAISAGLIPWSEVVGFDIFEVQRQKTLIVKVSNPEKYIEVGGAIKKALNMANFKMCGSPIAITSNSLKINFNELLDLCNSYLEKYGKSDQ